MKTFHN